MILSSGLADFYLDQNFRRELASLTASYWHADDSGEKSMCISFGLFFMIMSMGILVVDESILEFGLENGITNS